MKKPICKLVRTHREPFSRSFGTNETQQLREGQLVGRMFLQRLATGETGVKQARYRRRPTRGSEALSQPVGIEGPWHLLFNAWCNEFPPRVLHFSAFIGGVTMRRRHPYEVTAVKAATPHEKQPILLQGFPRHRAEAAEEEDQNGDRQRLLVSPHRTPDRTKPDQSGASNTDRNGAIYYHRDHSTTRYHSHARIVCARRGRAWERALA